MNTLLEATRTYTPDDLLLLKQDSHRYELLDGRLVERKMGVKAGIIAAIVIEMLREYARGHDGIVSTSEAGYQIWTDKPNRVRFPDVTYLARHKLPGGQAPDGYLRVAPDVAVEVVSPNDLAQEDVEDKIAEYLQAGVALLWIIYPKTQTLYAIRNGGHVRRLTAADELTGDDVLPGFSCKITELFENL